MLISYLPSHLVSQKHNSCSFSPSNNTYVVSTVADSLNRTSVGPFSTLLLLLSQIALTTYIYIYMSCYDQIKKKTLCLVSDNNNKKNWEAMKKKKSNEQLNNTCKAGLMPSPPPYPYVVRFYMAYSTIILIRREERKTHENKKKNKTYALYHCAATLPNTNVNRNLTTITVSECTHWVALGTTCRNR